MRDDRFHIRHLTGCVCIEMLFGTVVPAQHIAQIACTPTIERHAPTDGTMQPSFSIPSAFGSKHQCFVDGVDIWVGCVEMDAVCHFVQKLEILLKGCLSVYVSREFKAISTGKGLAITPHAPLFCVERITVCFETTRLVGTEVTIAGKTSDSDVFHHGFQGHIAIKSLGRESQQCRISIVKTSGIDEHFCIAPTMVTNDVSAHAFRVASLTEISGIEGYFSTFVSGKHLDVSTIPRIQEECKSRTVTGFETVLRVATIEGASESVLAIHTHESIILWNILQPSFGSTLIIVIGGGLQVVAHSSFLRNTTQRTNQGKRE